MDIAKLAEECAARHRIPETTITHPDGVIVVGDPFMTEKLKEPHYVPYCMKCEPMQRVRKMAWGFKCPGCDNKMNYDLSHYNGNTTVQYEGQPLSVGAWNAEVERKKSMKRSKQVRLKVS